VTDYAAVLIQKHAGREWTLNANDYDQLVMLDGGPKPSKASLDAAWPEVQAEITAAADAQTAARTSARTKLAALGLTEAEINALTGGI
jgi:hypothetical protein